MDLAQEPAAQARARSKRRCGCQSSVHGGCRRDIRGRAGFPPVDRRRPSPRRGLPAFLRECGGGIGAPSSVAPEDAALQDAAAISSSSPTTSMEGRSRCRANESEPGSRPIRDRANHAVAAGWRTSSVWKRSSTRSAHSGQAAMPLTSRPKACSRREINSRSRTPMGSSAGSRAVCTVPAARALRRCAPAGGGQVPLPRSGRAIPTTIIG